MPTPDFERAKYYAFERLRHELPPSMHYHSLAHTCEDVLPAAERLAAQHLIEPHAERARRITVGADKGFDTQGFVAEMREINVTPHVAQNDNGRHSAIDGRITRHAGYSASMRIRKRIEEAFGWIKTIGGLRKTRHRGRDKVRWAFTLTAAAYNLIRLPKLLGAAA